MHGLLVLDVGTGSGEIGAALQARGARVLATDINPHAARHAHGRGVGVVRCDLMGALKGGFDVVTFNAPYLPWDEEEGPVEGWLDHALHGGPTGVETTLRFVADLPRVLAEKGRAYVVVSSRSDLATLGGAVRGAGLTSETRGSARWFFEEVFVWRLTRHT